MKKARLQFLALVLVLSLILTGCGTVKNLNGTMVDDPENDNTPVPQDGVAASSPTPTENPIPEGSTVSVEVNGEISYYKTFADAWNMTEANATVPVTVTLLADLNGANGDLVGFEEITVERRSAPLTLDLNNYTIDRGHTSATVNGAVFSLNRAATVIIKNGTITGGNSTGSAGGLYLGADDLNVTLENLTVTGNYCAQRGAGIYLNPANNSKLTLNNVTITDNTAGGYAGGIYWAIDGTKRMSIDLKGKVDVSGNTGYTLRNNFVYDGKGLSGWLNTDELSTESKISVSYANGIGGPLADSFGNRINELKNCFISDQFNHNIEIYRDTLINKFKVSKAAVIHNGEWSIYDTFAQTWADASGYRQDCTATMVLFDDWIADSNGNFDDKGTYGSDCFCFNGGALYPGERTNGSWLDIDLNGHSINRNLYKIDGTVNSRKGNGRIFYLDENVNLHLMNGTLTGGNTSGKGGAIYCHDDDVNLYLTNMTITENQAAADGSAIYIDDMDSITFNTVTIENNYVDSKNEKVVAVNLEDGDIHMKGKILIRNNHSQKYPGEGQNNLALRDYIDSIGDYDSDMAGSEIHLTNVTNFYNALAQGGPYRKLTNGAFAPQADASMFRIDKELADAGYNTIHCMDVNSATGKGTLIIWECDY